VSRPLTREVCAGALQLHGAIGFTDEYELGLYLNRTLALAPWLGNASEHRRRYLDLTLGP
jgi:alkylation response protein AidB-like acyl-CoA dehydrogenase